MKREVSPTIVRMADGLQTIIIPLNGDDYDGQQLTMCLPFDFFSFFFFFFFFLIQKVSFDKY